MRHDPNTMCPARTASGRYCTMPLGHQGQCGYKNEGGQGGSWVRWWGANPRPVGWIDDLSWANLSAEIHRLRRLCDHAGIDWTVDVTMPGDHAVPVPS